MQGLYKIINLLDKVSIFSRWTNIIGIAALFLMIIFNFIDTIMDVVIFHRPIKGVTEITEIMMICGISLALAHCQDEKAHIAVDVITSQLSKKSRLVVDFITSIRSTAGSHERIAVVELFGRNSGETSLISAYLAFVDRAVISEFPFDVDKLAKFLLDDKRTNPSHYAIMTISEGAIFEGGDVVESGEADMFGHRKLGGIGLVLAEVIRHRTGEDILYLKCTLILARSQKNKYWPAVDLIVLKDPIRCTQLTGLIQLLRNSLRLLKLRGSFVNFFYLIFLLILCLIY